MGAIRCSCGTWNNDQAKFCRNCGSKLTPKATSCSSVSNNSSSSSSGMGTFGKLFLSALCIAAFIGISVATGGIGSISAVVLVPAFKEIWK